MFNLSRLLGDSFLTFHSIPFMPSSHDFSEFPTFFFLFFLPFFFFVSTVNPTGAKGHGASTCTSFRLREHLTYSSCALDPGDVERLQKRFMLPKKDGFLGSQHKAQFFIIFNDAKSAKKITRPHRRGVLRFLGPFDLMHLSG